jgi:dsDNA-specific endonuclease/ATPase MutS2
MIENLLDKAKSYREKVRELEFALDTFDKLKKSYQGKKSDFGAFELHILHEAHDMLLAKQISKEQFATILTQAISAENTE